MRLFLVILLLAGCSGSLVADTEEAKYTLVTPGEELEIRRYAPVMVAYIVVQGDLTSAGNAAFRPLAGYIGGKNTRNTGIPMTAPVNQRPNQEIPMTAPVNQLPGEAGSYEVQFVLPAGFTPANTPSPTDPRVRIKQLPEREVAVWKYQGGWSESRYRENEAAFRNELQRRGLTVSSPFIWARYDSPFRLWFLRRNEIQAEIRRTGSS